MQAIPNEFANASEVVTPKAGIMPHIGWGLIVSMAPILVIFWVGLAAILTGQTAIGSAKHLMRSLK